MTLWQRILEGPLDPALRATERRFTFKVLGLAIAAGLLGYFLFTRYPMLDLEIARSYWSGVRNRFADAGFWGTLRDTIYWTYTAFYLTIIAGLVLVLSGKPIFPAMRPRDWSYLISCSLAGPLLLTNLILQGAVDRPRPRMVDELGGSHAYVPVFEGGGTCDFGCSFVSGEVSSLTMILASLMFVSRRLRPFMAVLYIPAWALIGYLRVRAGGHFTSDVFFAGIFMMLIAAAIYWIMYVREGSDQPAPTPAEELAAAGRSYLRISDAVMAPVMSAGLAILDRLFPRR